MQDAHEDQILLVFNVLLLLKLNKTNARLCLTIGRFHSRPPNASGYVFPEAGREGDRRPFAAFSDPRKAVLGFGHPVPV